mmetsp:Transcript_5473/g.10283  ORF Transcript_5473/g.10283 Transcript_5473/m.10283 type:complete len:144 (-) Transcript_5473:52-483(-)
MQRQSIVQFAPNHWLPVGRTFSVVGRSVAARSSRVRVSDTKAGFQYTIRLLYTFLSAFAFLLIGEFITALVRILLLQQSDSSQTMFNTTRVEITTLLRYRESTRKCHLNDVNCELDGRHQSSMTMILWAKTLCSQSVPSRYEH